MRVIVYAHLMEIGGSQLCAVDLAGRTAEHGHEVTLFAPPGDLVALARSRGLRVVHPPDPGRWPTRRNVRELVALVRETRADVVHGYEWGPAAEVILGPFLATGTPGVATCLSMDVPDFMPTSLPLIVGTHDLYCEQCARRGDVHLMEPPIDTRRHAPSDPAIARTILGLGSDDVVVSVVGRLTTDLGKLSGVLEAIDAVGQVGRHYRVVLLVVGDGPGLGATRTAAAVVNRSLGREAVRVVGSLIDPDPAYAAADIVLGMGSSALKGMAHGRPLVVQGEGGFWRLFDEGSAPSFRRNGWWGQGGAGTSDLVTILHTVIADPARRAWLGSIGRDLVLTHYDLERATDQVITLYDRVLAPTRRQRIAAAARMGADMIAFKAALARHRRGDRP